MTTTDQILGVRDGLAIKTPCRVATSSNVTLSGLQTIDGVALSAGDRVLVTAQSDASQNGIYVAAVSGWARARDMNGARDVVSGTQVLVTSGSVWAGRILRLTTADPITIDTSNLTFEQVPFPVGAKVIMLDTVAELAATAIPAEVTTVILAGYASAGDGGQALYSRAVSLSPYGGVTSSDGAFWNLTPQSSTVDVRQFGARLDGSDDAPAIQKAIDFLSAGGGGVFTIPAGTATVGEAVILKDKVVGRGAGKGVTAVKLANGANDDVFRSVDFATLDAATTFQSGAPKYLGLCDMTIDGNWLANGQADAYVSSGVTINNTSGSAVRLYATHVILWNVFLYNSAEHLMVLSEDRAVSRNASIEFRGVDTIISVEGMVCGKEAAWIKGPGDTYYHHMVFSRVCCVPNGAAPTGNAGLAEIPSIVVEDGGDIGFAHVSGNSYGPGFWWKDGRCSGAKLISENNINGMLIASAATEPRISELMVRDLRAIIGGGTPTYGLRCDADGLVCSIMQVFRSGDTVESDGWLACDLRGARNTVQTLKHENTNNSATGNDHAGDLLSVSGDDARVHVVAQRVQGDAVLVDECNRAHITGVVDGCTGTGFIRNAGTSNQFSDGRFELTLVDCQTAYLELNDLADNERADFTLRSTTGTPTWLAAGSDAPDAARKMEWHVRAEDVAAGTRRSSRGRAATAALDTNTTTGAKSITVAHESFFTPDAGQISVQLIDPAARNNDQTVSPRVETVTSSNVTFSYQVVAVGSGTANVTASVTWDTSI